MRKGMKTTEFWVAGLATLFALVQQKIWPETPFPEAEFSMLTLWIAARIGEKTLGPAGTNGKRAWQTSEFWFAIGFAVVRQFIDIPPASVTLVQAWIVGRPLAKVTSGFGLLDIFKKK